MEYQEIKQKMQEVLTPREWAILEERLGLGEYFPRTLDQVGRTFGLNKERIRQIEAKALAKIEGSLEHKKIFILFTNEVCRNFLNTKEKESIFSFYEKRPFSPTKWVLGRPNKQ